MYEQLKRYTYIVNREHRTLRPFRLSSFDSLFSAVVHRLYIRLYIKIMRRLFMSSQRGHSWLPSPMSTPL